MAITTFFQKMWKISSLDFVILESTIFGVNQQFTGRYVGSRIAWVAGTANVCFSLTILGWFIVGGYLGVDDKSTVDSVARIVYYYSAIIIVLIIQIRNQLFRRSKMANVGLELYHLYESSTWQGDVWGCIARILVYLITITVHQTLPELQDEWKSQEWRWLTICFYWMNFTPTAASEFVGQAMLLFEHEFKVLRSEIKDCIGTRENSEREEKLRVLNRRHASLYALCNSVARMTGIDSLLMIENERLLILLTIFISVNLSAKKSIGFRLNLISVLLYIYRIERITHPCFRGFRVHEEAKRLVNMLDEFDPLDMENDEVFTEFQIIRKQAKLRKLNFDCNRFLKLNTKLIFQISKDLFTLIIILLQLTTP